MSLALFFLPSGSHSAQAAVQTFAVKQVTYSGNVGFFRCEAKLGADDNATLTVKVPTADAQKVQASIHASPSAKISSAVSGTDTIISIVISSDRVANAGITFERKIADPFKINYGIELNCNELDGYIQVFDRSGANANWSNAQLQIVLRTGDICLTLTMDSGQSNTSPVEAFANYPIALANLPQFRAHENQAYEVQQLTNPGSETLLLGDVRVMHDGVLQYESALTTVLPAKQSAEIRGKPVDADKISVKSSTQADRWYETVSITNGVLTYSPWKVTKTTITNQTGSEIKIYIERSATEHTLVSATPTDIFTPIDKVKLVDNKPFTANLFDLSEKTLELHIQKLQEFGDFRGNVSNIQIDKDRIDNIQKQLVEILKAKTALMPLKAVKKEIDELLKAEPKECKPDSLSKLTESLKRIEKVIQTAQCAQMAATDQLILQLLPDHVDQPN